MRHWVWRIILKNFYKRLFFSASFGVCIFIFFGIEKYIEYYGRNEDYVYSYESWLQSGGKAKCEEIDAKHSMFKLPESCKFYVKDGWVFYEDPTCDGLAKEDSNERVKESIEHNCHWNDVDSGNSITKRSSNSWAWSQLADWEAPWNVIIIWTFWFYLVLHTLALFSKISSLGFKRVVMSVAAFAGVIFSCLAITKLINITFTEAAFIFVAIPMFLILLWKVYFWIADGYRQDK